MDDSYQTYLNRLARMTLPDAYNSQAQHIQESPKFTSISPGAFAATPFPGYTVITPPKEEDRDNSAFYEHIQVYQQQLLELPINQDNELIVPVPPASFHLTLADLIWDGAYRDVIEQNPDFEPQLRGCLEEIFQQYQQSLTQIKPIRWQILGLMLMPRAVGVCLVPLEQDSYEQVIQFRRSLYQNPKLIALGIEQHYHLTAHITLGYFGKISPELDRTLLAKMFWEINQKWSENLPEFLVGQAQLRKFDNMMQYYRQPDWPSLDWKS